MALQTGLEPVTRPVRNIVALLRLERSHCSLFLPARAPPASEISPAGSGIASAFGRGLRRRPATPGSGGTRASSQPRASVWYTESKVQKSSET